jgi:methyl-accepting chemotaxis protein
MKNGARFQVKSIQMRIALWSGLCLLVIAAALTGYAAVTMRNSEVAAVKDEALATASQRAALVDAEIEVALDAARTLAQSFSAITTHGSVMSRDQVNAMLRKVLELNPNFLGVYTLWEPDAFDGKDSLYKGSLGHDETGRFIPYWVRSGNEIIVEPLMGYEEEGAGDYYLIPKRTLQEQIIDPYLYPIDGVDVLLTSLVVPIIVDGEFLGIAGVDMGLTFLQGIADQQLEKGAELLIISNNGTVAGATGMPELSGQHMQAYHTDWEEDIQYILDGHEILQDDEGRIAIFSPIHFGSTPTPWSVNLNIPLDAVVAEANAVMWRMIGLAVVLAALALALLWFAAGQVAKPVKKITALAHAVAMGDLEQSNDVYQADEVGQLADAFREMVVYLQEMTAAAQSLAQGDLAQEVRPRSGKDSFGSAFAQMILNLRQAVGKVASNAGALGLAAGQLAAAATQAGQATNQIAATVQQVAKGAAQQSDSVSRTAVSVEQMAHSIDGLASGAQKQAAAVSRASQITSQISGAIIQVAGNAQAVSRDSDAAARSARSGATTVEQTVQGMQAIKVKVDLSAQKVQEMGQRSDQIGAIVEAIEDIASQTNLLALNAAIEAARAGEHGKGFAVVADEVRKLAERASGATKEIGGLIKGIQVTVNEAVAAMQESAHEVEAGVSSAQGAGGELKSILQAAEAVSRQAEQASQAAQSMTEMANNLVAAMDAVSSVVEENTTATGEMTLSANGVNGAIENIASISEENSAAIEEVSAGAEEMSAQVEEVTASAQSLSEMAQALRGVVAQFKLATAEQAVSVQPVEDYHTRSNGRRKKEPVH